MPHISNKQAVMASILDRLMDDEPDKLYEPIKSRHQQLLDLYASVRRDLENLLNTRQMHLTWPKNWGELNNSLLAYGVPDFMGNALESSEAQKKFCADIASIINRFEPRLKNIKVTWLANEEQHYRTLRMRIEGLLLAEPAPQSIVFDSRLEPETNSFLLAEAVEK